jgi:hypothetical protein
VRPLDLGLLLVGALTGACADFSELDPPTDHDAGDAAAGGTGQIAGAGGWLGTGSGGAGGGAGVGSGGSATGGTASGGSPGGGGTSGGSGGTSSGGSPGGGGAPSQCKSNADCPPPNSCVKRVCTSGQCVSSFVAKGTSCSDNNACNGVESCDGAGLCAPGTPPAVSDGNACTLDSCDPATGVKHVPLVVDDNDACTADSCNQSTGAITHTKLTGQLVCSQICPSGLYVFAKGCNPSCSPCSGSQWNVTNCIAACDPMLYVCGTTCPPGYTKQETLCTTNCGSVPCGSGNNTVRCTK